MSSALVFNQLATNGDTSCSFATFGVSDNIAVAIMLAVADSADFTDPTVNNPSIVDNQNNVYNLMYTQINQADSISGKFVAIAIYLCIRPAIGGGGPPAIVNIVSDLTPGDVDTSFVYGMTYATLFNQFQFDVATLSLSNAAGFSMNAGTVPNGLHDLVQAVVIDSALGDTGDMTFTGGTFNPSEEFVTTGPTHGDSVIIAYKDAATSLGTQNIVATIAHGTATALDGFLLGIRAVQATGGAGKQLTFQISKGPDPKILPEGRAIATVIIDGSQQPFSPIVTPPGINLPEFAFFGSNVTDSWETYWQTEFDLESVGPQGSRMSEVRGLIARSRPFFGIDPGGNRSDNPGWNGTAGRYAIAFLTNITTQQTVVLGGHALFDNDSLDEGQAMSETIHRAIPANAGGMKFRFVVVCNNTRPDGAGLGKWILNFTNFDLPSDSVVSEAIGAGRYD